MRDAAPELDFDFYIKFNRFANRCRICRFEIIRRFRYERQQQCAARLPSADCIVDDLCLDTWAG